MTIIAKTSSNNPDEKIITQAAHIIINGGLVSFPTETVYGLGADALNPEAVKHIYEAKMRPADKALIIHVSSIAQAEELVFMNDIAKKLACKFWPGPLTLILPARAHIPLITRGGHETAAVRMPANEIARELIRMSKPVAAPSANLSGRPSPVDAESVIADMSGRIDMIIDGGICRAGIESTVLDVSNPEKIIILRPGMISREELEKFLGLRIFMNDNHEDNRRHYSPLIPVKLWEAEKNFPEHDETAAYMGVKKPPEKISRANIYVNYEEYAQKLYIDFRMIEKSGASMIIAELPEDNTGICCVLRDRIIHSAGKSYV